jgi:uncharacterized protein (DUF433 family)
MSDLAQGTPVQEGTQPLKQIRKSELVALVNEGKKRPEIAAHFGLKEAQVAKLLKAAGLKIRKFHLPTFQLVDDVEEVQPTQEAVVVQEVLASEEVATMPAPEVTEAAGHNWSRPVTEE